MCPCCDDGGVGGAAAPVAQTGSGKTLAFVLPAFHLFTTTSAGGGGVEKRPSPRGLVLAPTRELAVQIQAECEKFLPPGEPIRVTAMAAAWCSYELCSATPGRSDCKAPAGCYPL